MSSDAAAAAIHARTTSREDRILSAKKKLSKYRKAQRNQSSGTQVIPCSPVGSTVTSSKRSSFNAAAAAAAVPPSPLRHSRKPSSNANNATTTSNSHAHRRSRSRISVSMPSSKHHTPSSAVARLSALLAFEHNATGGGSYPSVDLGKPPSRQRQSDYAGQDTCTCPPTPSSSAPTSAQISTPKSPMRTRPTPVSPSRQALPITPERVADVREQPVASTSRNVLSDVSSQLRKSQVEQTKPIQHSRRDSRRHSRNLSIVSVADVGGATIASPFHVSSPFIGGNRIPLATSSPVPSRQQAKLGGGFTFGNAGSYSTNKRQSGNLSNATAFSAAPSSRILSPHHSPILHQSTMSASPYPSYSSSRLQASNAFGFAPTYAPVASGSTGMAAPARRASLQIQQSQAFNAQSNSAFPSSAQRMQSEPGASFAPCATTAMQMTPSIASVSSMQGNPLTTSHGRRPSRHTRRTSVATRRESMEIMSGIPCTAGGSPDPNMSATAAFLASTVSDQGFGVSQGMSRSSTWTSLGDGVQEERQFELQTPSHSTANTYLSPRPFASGMRRTLSQEEELERASALSALEGRISSKSEIIELPSQTALDVFAETLAARAPPPGNAHSNVGAVSPSPLKAFEQRRGSWQTGLAVSPAVLHNTGGRGATDLGMLVEEEEDVDSETTMNMRRSSSSSSSDDQSTISPLKASSGSRQSLTSLSSSSNMRKSRPASLIFPSSRALPFAARSALSPHSSTETAISPLKQLPRSLPLSTSTTSLTSPASSTADVSSARRMSGLRSLTLATSQASALESPLTGRRSALISERPSQVSPSHSYRDGNARVRKMSSGNIHASTPSKTATSAQRSSLTTQSAPRASIQSSSPASAHRESITAFSFNPSVFADRRDSELSVNSTFGSLVMEDAPMEDSFASQETHVDDSTSIERSSTERLNISERPVLSRSTSSEDPIILSMQVQGLRQRLEHQSAEHLQEIAALRATHTAETDDLQRSLSTAKLSSQLFKEERDSLREDNDDWRMRCNDLEGHLSAERRRLEDERKENHLLRDKVRKLSDRLAAVSTGQNGSASNAFDDQQLATAQAKLIGEMRDQIFSLAAALERERIKSAGGDSSRSSSPLLKALASKVADEQAADDARLKQAASMSRVLTQSPSQSRVSQLQHQHQPREGSSASMGSYSYSSKSGSNWSGHSSMGAAPDTENTSIADDDSVFGVAKSPVSPLYPLSATSSFSLPATTLTAAGISIGMHPLSIPLRRDDSVTQSGLGTLAEEDEESTEGSETVDLNTQVQIIHDEMDDAVYSTDDGEGTDNVPDLIPDEFRARTQSASTDSGNTNDQMPLTPCRESAAIPIPLPGPQARHHRSDSFIKHWSFPRGCIEQSAMEEHESFWALPSETLPALPVTPGAADVPPFSADITMDEDYFSDSFQLHLKRLTVQALQGPPVSRSSAQSRQLSQDGRAAVNSTGSRLSLQGITSSLWNWRGSSSSNTPTSAPPLIKKSSMLLEQQRRPEQSQRESQFAPFESVSLTTPVSSGLRRLLRLEPTPVSRLDFTHSCFCEPDSRIINV